MNRRLRKKSEKCKRKLIHGLLDLALDINGLEPRKQDITGNRPTVFFDFSGHIGVVHIRIHANGWYPDADTDRDFWLYAYDQKNLVDGLQELKAVKAGTPAAGTAGEPR